MQQLLLSAQHFAPAWQHAGFGLAEQQADFALQQASLALQQSATCPATFALLVIEQHGQVLASARVAETFEPVF